MAFSINYTQEWQSCQGSRRTPFHINHRDNSFCSMPTPACWLDNTGFHAECAFVVVVVVVIVHVVVVVVIVVVVVVVGLEVVVLALVFCSTPGTKTVVKTHKPGTLRKPRTSPFSNNDIFEILVTRQMKISHFHLICMTSPVWLQRTHQHYRWVVV